MIDLKKPIKFVSERATKDGWTAMVVTDKGFGPYCLLGVATSPGKHSFPLQWRADGKTLQRRADGKTHWACPDYWDICNVPEKIKVDVWLNVYKNPIDGKVFTTSHSTLAEATVKTTFSTIGWSAQRLACLHVEAEVGEGFGLTPPATDEE